MPSISYIVASAAAIASVQASGYCSEDCNPSSSNSAFSICNNALINGVFADWVNLTPAELTSYCLGFCDDGSRLEHFPDNIPGAVWDICAGCDTSTTASVCTMCSNAGTGVAFCASPTNRDKTCNLIFADPVGPSTGGDEYVGATADAEACRMMVTATRSHATGMAWSTLDSDGDGLGSCYAEYGSTSYGNVGVSHYSSCIFDWSEDTTVSTASTAGGGSIAEVTEATEATEATAAPNIYTPSGTGGSNGEGNAGSSGSGNPGNRGGAGGEGGGHHKGKNGSGKGEMGCGGKGKGKGGGKGKGKGEKGEMGCGKKGLQATGVGLSAEGGAAIGLAALVVLVAGVLSMTAYKRYKAAALDMSDEEEMSALIMTEDAPLLDGDEKENHRSVEDAMPVMA